MTTCRFCTRVVLNDPKTLKSVDNPLIINFLRETTINLERSDEMPVLICKMCEMSAKNNFAFIEQIKNSQEHFKKSQPAHSSVIAPKRHVPSILKNSKKGKKEEQIVGTIGSTTIIRFVGNICPALESNNNQFIKDEAEEVKRGESSKAFNSSNIGFYSCSSCNSVFDDSEKFSKHFPNCFAAKCPLCLMEFENPRDLKRHNRYNHIKDENGEIVVD